MIVAHADRDERRRIAGVLARGGHEVLEAPDSAGALSASLEGGADVLLLDGALGDDLVERIKADAHAFRLAVVLVEREEPDAERTAALLERGVQDILIAPARDAELLTRVHAAGRTKVLQEEIVAQAGRLETLIFEDPLTGLANRRFILTQLSGLISAARRHDRPLAVAILDVDHFKLVNDRYGHAEGDRVLAAVAESLRTNLRAEDQLGRLGGEEFLALLPDTSADAAPAAADKLRRSVLDAGVTVSVGWAVWDGERGEELLRRADEALYAAKSRGRDCVVGAPASLPRRR